MFLTCTNGILLRVLKHADGAAFANAPRQLALHDLSAYHLLGHVGSHVLSLEVHNSDDLALTFDQSGCALIWQTDPLAPELVLPEKEVSPPLIQSHHKALVKLSFGKHFTDPPRL